MSGQIRSIARARTIQLPVIWRLWVAAAVAGTAATLGVGHHATSYEFPAVHSLHVVADGSNGNPVAASGEGPYL